MTMRDIVQTPHGPYSEGLSILAVDGISFTNVTGTNVQVVGSLSYVNDVVLANVSIAGPPGGGGHGWNCKKDVSGVRSVGKVQPPVC